MIENPILRGFCPDPSIIRVGEDYYIATSTFEWWPGIHLFHSKDLKNWEQIASPLQRMSQANLIGDPTSGGIWAPCLSYHGGTFYIVYTDVKTKKGRYYNNHNYLIYTDDLAKGWSEPIYLNSTGFDPSLFHDIDGKKYLVNMRNGFKGILLQEYEHDKKALVGEVKNIYRGTEYGFTEGPHLYHVGDFYYLIVAEGGTGYGHCVTQARSKNIWGTYETDPNNPMLTSRENEDVYLKKCGHADFTDTPYGEWYMVHLCSRPNEGKTDCLLGRETALQKVYWNEDGWLRLVGDSTTAQTFVEEPKNTKEVKFQIKPEKDDFDEEELDVIYSTPRLPLLDNISFSERKGYLRLYGQESLNSLHRVSFVARRQTEYHAMAETSVLFSPKHPEQVAGITYFYDAMNYYFLGKTVDEEGNEIIQLIKSDTGVIDDMIEPIRLMSHEQLYLKVETDKLGETAAFYYSLDNINWIDVNVKLSTKILTDEHCRGFTGAHFGMFCFDMTGQRITADFDYFTYRTYKNVN
jgi:xylan 1,4-beta-xylosidase